MPPPPRIHCALRAVSSIHTSSLPTRPSIDALCCRRALTASLPTTTTWNVVRHASHQAQGRANGPKNSPGKRLGAKKTGEEYVIPGNIIFRQRGTKWHAGENAAMGRDHTIHAAQPGFVKYYTDPARHPKRRYIGVVFERNQTLPTPPNAARRRRLGLVAVRRTDLAEQGEGDLKEDSAVGGLVFPLPKPKRGKAEGVGQGTATRRELKMSSNYQFREPNWWIGQIPEREGISQKVRKYDRGDRFLAWRKREGRKARNAERNMLGASKAGKKKGKGKK